MIVLYGSEDEGFRFPIEKPFATLHDALSCDYVKRMGNLKTYKRADEFTKEQLENMSRPNVHGEVIGVMLYDYGRGSNGWDSIVLDDDAYSYDFIFVIELEVK